MAWSTPRTWSTGELVTAAHMNQEVRDNLTAAHPIGVDAWTAFTPALLQSGAVTKTVSYGKYQRVGRWVTAQVYLAVTATGTASNTVIVGIPVTAAFGSNMPCGSGFVYDTSANITYGGIAVLNTTTGVALQPTSTDTPSLIGAGVFTAALGSGDVVAYSITYEAAT